MSDEEMVGEERVSHYKILSKLGAGGMGEVYLALDTSLERNVALKFIVGKDQEDPSAQRLMLREARAAAALDHPYICDIYEVGEASGRRFLAMEYVEGVTLAEKLAAGPLPLLETLAYTCEIAEALEHAHSKGVVHRDLKPSNIMLTASGHIKIMDFGLSRRVALPGNQETNISTLSSNGRLAVGTLPYMSPEQLRGEDADGRSDIFSLGVVLFQMLTGVHPFLRPTPFETGFAILKADPEPLSRLLPGAPRSLEPIIDKMLAKERDRRYASARDLCSELAQVMETDRPSGLAGGSARWHRTRALIAVAAAVALSLLVVLYSRFGRIAAVPDSGIQTSQPLVTWDSDEWQARICPDRQWYSFVSDRDGTPRLWIGRLPEGEPRRAESLQEAPLGHTWSPDGSELACLVRKERQLFLQVVPAHYQGAPRISQRLDEVVPAAVPDYIGVAGWVGDSIYVKVDSALLRCDSRSGDIEKISTGRADRDRGVRVRADGRKIVFYSGEEIWIADLNGANREQITNDRFRDFSPHWIRRGDRWLVVFSSNRGGQIDLVEMDLAGRSPRLLTSHGVDEQRIEDVAPDGSLLLYRNIQERANLWCVETSTAERRKLTADLLSDFAPVQSEATSVVAFQRTKPALAQGSRLIDTEIWIGSLEYPRLSGVRKIVDTGGAPQLSPDGRGLAYLQYRKAGSAFDLRLRDLETQQDLLVARDISLNEISPLPFSWGPKNVAWSRDGGSLYFVTGSPDGKTALRRHRIAPAEARGNDETLVASSAGEHILEPLPKGDAVLAYSVREDHDRPGWEIRLHGGASREGEVLFRDPEAARIYALGWMNDGLVLLRGRAGYSRGSLLTNAEVLLVDPAGNRREIRVVPLAHGESAVLDEERKAVYLTVVEDGIANIKSISVASGEQRALTLNDHRETTFAGLRVAHSGRLLYSQQTKASDLYLIRFQPPGRPGR